MVLVIKIVSKKSLSLKLMFDISIELSGKTLKIQVYKIILKNWCHNFQFIIH